MNYGEAHSKLLTNKVKEIRRSSWPANMVVFIPPGWNQLRRVTWNKDRTETIYAGLYNSTPEDVMATDWE